MCTASQVPHLFEPRRGEEGGGGRKEKYRVGEMRQQFECDSLQTTHCNGGGGECLSCCLTGEHFAGLRVAIAGGSEHNSTWKAKTRVV